MFSAIYVRHHQKKKYHIGGSDDVVTTPAQHYRVEFMPASTSGNIIAASTAEVAINPHFDGSSDDIDQGDFDQGDFDHDDGDDKGGVDVKAKDDDHKAEVSKICIQRFIINRYMDQIISLLITLWSCAVIHFNGYNN